MPDFQQQCDSWIYDSSDETEQVQDDKVDVSVSQTIINDGAFLSRATQTKEKDMSKSAENKPKASICVEFCYSKLVVDVAKKFGMPCVQWNKNWDVLWSESSITDPTRKHMEAYQICNKLPSILALCRKSQLARNLQMLKANFPDECDFFPDWWQLPQDKREVVQYLRQEKEQGTMIIKPDNGSNGKGIFLAQRASDLELVYNKSYICQRYIENPLLIDGYKFDMRLYVLITSCDPLRIFVHSEGLARFATIKYERPHAKNLKSKCMHLTNYSVNKHSPYFVIDDEIGSKRKISAIKEWLNRNNFDADEVWLKIHDIIIKTILSSQASMKRMYHKVFNNHNRRSACFQFLGFDIILDEKASPYVLEVNQFPSLYTNANLDLEIKTKVVQDIFTLCNLAGSIRKDVQEDRKNAKNCSLKNLPGRGNRKIPVNKEFMRRQWCWEESHCGGYRLVYPGANTEKYEKMCAVMDAASSYKLTLASQFRTAHDRATRA